MDKKQGIQSLELGIQILKVVSESEKPLTITKISNLCGISKSKAHRYLISLLKTNFLTRDEDLKYSIGSELILIALRSLENIDIGKIATPYLQNLRDKVNETVALALWGEKGPFFLKWEPSNKHINLDIRQGTQISVTQSASGKIFAAFLPKEQTEQVISTELNGDEEKINNFYKGLDKIREKKFANTIDTLIQLFQPFLYPFLENNEIMACLVVVGFTKSLDPSEDSEIAVELKHVAKLLSYDLGYRA